MDTALRIAAFAVVLGACQSEGTVDYQTNIDNFAQAPNNEVDILWVVDNSYSMTEEQAALIGGFTSFASVLEESGMVFHIGVINTSFDSSDTERGVLIGDPPFLTNEDDYETQFASRATVGISGSDKEKGLEAALYALSPFLTAPGYPNEGFLRPDAHLLVIWVSDEEDCSDGGTLEGQSATACYTEMDQLTPVPEIVEDLYDIKDGKREMLSVGAIVGVEDDPTCPETVQGTRYLQTVRMIGGKMGNICDSDWSDVLSDLGLTATGIHTQFQLSQAAQKDTIQVWVDDVEVAEDPVDGWTYNELSWWLTFNGTSVPDRGSQITVKYTVDPGKLDPQTTTAATE